MANSERPISSDRNVTVSPCVMAWAARLSPMRLLPVPVLAPHVTTQVRASPMPPPSPRHSAFSCASGVGTASTGASFSSSSWSSVSPTTASNATAGGSAPMGVAVRRMAAQVVRQSSPRCCTAWCRSQKSLTGTTSSPAPTFTSRSTNAFGRSAATDATSVEPPWSGSCHTTTFRPAKSALYSLRHCEAPGSPTATTPRCHAAWQSDSPSTSSTGASLGAMPSTSCP